ncbi:MAG: redoxin family protein [Planctomycetes bacterium]|nr:redoxin family protein [Planctomycetota bacterium]
MNPYATFTLVPLLALAAPIYAQDSDAKTVFETFQKSLPKGRPKSQAEADAFLKSAKELAEQTLKEHEKVLGSGDGLHYRGMIHLMTRDVDAALAAYQSHAAAKATPALQQESIAYSAMLLLQARQDVEAARAMLAKIDEKLVEGRTKGLVQMLNAQIQEEAKRGEMIGKEPPALEVEQVLNGPKEVTLAQYRGKVVVLDFWATWCPPCRMVIPDLVKMQAAHDKDVQVLGITQLYGHGMRFEEGNELPHGGKSVKDLAPDDEVAVNEAFIKAFAVNYPIVFTKAGFGDEKYGVQGIPTIFVIGKDGKLVGSVVGADHKSVEKLVTKALGGTEKDAKPAKEAPKSGDPAPAKKG